MIKSRRDTECRFQFVELSSAMSWKKPPSYLVPRKQDVNISRSWLCDHVIRNTAMPAYIGDETPKVARAHATSIAFVR